eukprot:7108007-Pyramimonas_sp.AAC.1
MAASASGEEARRQPSPLGAEPARPRGQHRALQQGDYLGRRAKERRRSLCILDAHAVSPRQGSASLLGCPAVWSLIRLLDSTGWC